MILDDWVQAGVSAPEAPGQSIVSMGRSERSRKGVCWIRVWKVRLEVRLRRNLQSLKAWSVPLQDVVLPHQFDLISGDRWTWQSF